MCTFGFSKVFILEVKNNRIKKRKNDKNLYEERKHKQRFD